MIHWLDSFVRSLYISIRACIATSAHFYSCRQVESPVNCLDLHRFSPHSWRRNSPFFLVSDIPTTLIISKVV